jgi:uncharacterized protein (TIGR02453 family)
MTAEFQGFSQAGLQFLLDLALNNERSWFQPRKAEYERLLKEPLEAFCVALDRELSARGLPLSADPGRSPFRIYRDVRFSKDKSPYKTHVSASFPWSGEGGGVGGYLHIQAGDAFAGGGMWHPAPERLMGWRRTVVEDRQGVLEILNDPRFRDTFGTVDGDRLKRAPTGFAADDPDIELLKLKDVTFGHRLADAELGSPELPVTVAATLERAVPLLRLLATLPGGEGGAAWLRD